MKIKNSFHQAIETRYFGPTNYRGSRVKAISQATTVTVVWDHALNPEDNHAAAAQALIDKMGWQGKWIQGALPGNHSGYAFVCIKRNKNH